MKADATNPISTPVLHDGAQILATTPLTIETAAAQWAYAVHFELSGEGSAPADTIAVIAEVEVSRGEIGLGLLSLDEKTFHVERHVAADDGTTRVVLAVRPEQPTQKLVVRNVGGEGEAAVVTIRRLVMGTDRALGEPQTPTLQLSSELFKNFECFAGPVRAGLWVNWLGVVTRSGVWPFPPEIQALYARDRDERGEFPLNDEHVLDWVPLLEAVMSSKGGFRMVALGAGWGRWLTAGAFAARQRGLPFHLTGVEAEPDHFAWMEQHMRDNDIPAECVRLLHGAASARPEPCWFPVSDSSWYGQSIVADVPDSALDPQGDALVSDMRLRRVPAVTIQDVLGGPAAVDYLHMDIQGTEFDFLASGPDLLRRFVRIVNVGTHSELIERRLRRLFGQLGWTPRYDVSLGTTMSVQLDGGPVRRLEFGDGVQVWQNPALG
jgi:FkbM family methyltransferase